MDRRGFLKGLLGVAAAAALPAKAVQFLAINAEITDAAFKAKANIELIGLIESRIRHSDAMFIKMMDESIYSDACNAPPQNFGLGALVNSA